MRNYLIRKNDYVEFAGKIWRVVAGPVMGTEGSLFDIQNGEDTHRGIWEHQLKKVFPEDRSSD